MTRLTLSHSDLYVKVSEFMKWGSSPADDYLTKVKDIVARGYRTFLYPVNNRTGSEHSWSFLKQFMTINLASGKWKYALPEDFSEMVSDPRFDDEDGYSPLVKVAPDRIIDNRVLSQTEGFPEYYSIVTAPYNLETGTYYEMWVDPEPDGIYLLQIFYKIDPLKPEETTDFLVGGPKAAEVILESCLSMAEIQEKHTAGIHTQMANDLIQRLIIADSEMDDGNYIGNLYQDRREWPPRRGYLNFNNITIYP